MRPGRRVVYALGVVPVLLGLGCGREPVESLPDARATLMAVARRLGGSRSIDDLNAIAARGDRVLRELSPRERDALGRGYLRFRIDRPALLVVAAPAASLPFWLSDQGFIRGPMTFEVLGGSWLLFEKPVAAGWVGLGVNGLDRTSTSHYVVFLRPSAGPGAPAVTGLDPSRWEAVEARPEVSIALDATTPVARLPKALRGSTLLRPSRDLRHSTILARGRVWKTHVASSRTPDQIALTFGPDPSRSLSWTWRTAPETRATALRIAVAADPTSPDPATIRTVAGDSWTIASPNLLNDPLIRRHRVALDDLRPDTRYVYAVGDGTPAGWSPWASVKTGPATRASCRFLYLGDAQCGLEAWGSLLRGAHRRHPDAAFLLLAGDLVDRGNERTNWDHFFLRAKGVFEALPVMPCAGNHEYLDRGPRLYSALFDPPRNGPPGIAPGLVYSFAYGDAFVAVLDSTDAAADPDSARLQADWLDGALRAARATWKLVMFHHPVYASHPTREYPALRDAWVPVFDRHRVDLVLQGHDHAYQRTHPLRSHRRVATGEFGTTYVVSVSGEKLCPQAPRDYTAVALSDLPTYQTIDIDATSHTLDYRAWDPQGREVDRLVLGKRMAAASRGVSNFTERTTGNNTAQK